MVNHARPRGRGGLRAALLLAALVAAGRVVPATVARGDEAAPPASVLDGILSRTVKDGRVDYAGLSRLSGELDRYLALLAATKPESIDTRYGAIAFWINAYNAFSLRLILRHYPGITSIRDLHDPWTTREWDVGGKRYSLDEIENDVLRGRYHDPRIHFALVCASLGCPDLLDHAYTGRELNAQLDRAARRFLNSSRGLHFEPGPPPVLVLSPIFDWFAGDFTRGGGELLDFILPYLKAETRRSIESSRDSLSIRFADYDWGLNDIARNG